MKVHNVHERVVPAPAEAFEPLLAALGGPDDVLWPSPEWTPMVLDRPLAVGASGGHGRIRYHVSAYEPGRRVEFTFDPRIGFDGTHTFTVEPLGPSRTRFRHVIDGEARWPMQVLWPGAVRFAHDVVLEQILDRAEVAVGTGPVRAARVSPIARLVRLVHRPAAHAAAVPATALLTDALPRVDFADAYAVAVRPGTPTDPQAWADAVFRDPPGWVAGLMGLREALVGLVGIERGRSSAFDTIAATDDEVLLGTDAGHLDFRASVLREADRVVVTTVVRLKNARGRGYFALVRLVHPVIVRAMVTRAAATLSRSSNRRPALPATIRA